MDKIKENNLYLRILKFWEEHTEWFTYKQIKERLKLQDWENQIIEEYLINALKNSKYYDTIYWGNYKDSVFFMIECEIPQFSSHSLEHDIDRAKFIIKYDAYFNYIDYLELQKAIENSKEANNHAKNAKRLALISIWIAIITWAFQISKDSWLVNFFCNLF